MKEIKELLSLRAAPDTDCAEVKQRPRQKVADIRQRLDDLQRMKGALEEFVRSCNSRRPASECPILESLGD